MLQRKEFVEHGDWVVVNDSQNVPRFVQAIESQSFSNKEGNFMQSDLVGIRYGGKLYNMTKTGFVHVLHPTAHLWPSLVDFRTQILYQPDISLIQYFLNLKPGSVVIESGTGSGVLTTSLARSVAPFGHVHTFEFHPERVIRARNDFIMNKVDSVVTVRQRDILERGFPFFPQGVDAAFLDLPSPQDVIISVDKSLRPQGRICNFSPCIEQVQRVCLKLQELGYEEIITVEILAKEYELLRCQGPNSTIYNQGALLSGIASSNGPLGSAMGNQYAIGQLTYVNDCEKEAQQRNKQRQEKAILAKQQKKAQELALKNNDVVVSTDQIVASTNGEQEKLAGEDVIKKAKVDDTVQTIDNELHQLDPIPTPAPKLTLPPSKLDNLPKYETKTNNFARPKILMRGHTGYLTFARKRASTTPIPNQEYATPFTKHSIQ
jgi:tRNA (adenine57-N1/adenine58-N1)-methyltransferase